MRVSKAKKPNHTFNIVSSSLGNEDVLFESENIRDFLIFYFQPTNKMLLSPF